MSALSLQFSRIISALVPMYKKVSRHPETNILGLSWFHFRKSKRIEWNQKLKINLKYKFFSERSKFVLPMKKHIATPPPIKVNKKRIMISCITWCRWKIWCCHAHFFDQCNIWTVETCPLSSLSLIFDYFLCNNATLCNAEF